MDNWNSFSDLKSNLEAEKDLENFEDGEIKVIDDENYILSDSYFNF